MACPRSLRWWFAIAVLLCAGMYLIGNGRVPLWDRDEAWYAQCSKEMWQTGDWVVPRFLGDLRTQKPVLVHWLQLGGCFLFGGPSDFAVRFYAAAAQVTVLLIIGVAFWKLAGPLRGTWALLIYGTCAMAVVSAKMCLTDATLMVFVMVTQVCLMAFYLGHFNWWAVVLLFVSLGFAGLTKGPIALVPGVFTVLALGILDIGRWWPLVRPDRRASWDRICLAILAVLGGLALAMMVAAPWLYLVHQRAPEWLVRAIGAAGRHASKALDGHSGPFGYYAVMDWATFFPWSLLIPAAAYVAWKQRHVPVTRFAIAAVLGPWLFYELLRTKLPHYVLPTFPFVALLVADALVRCARRQYRELHRTSFVVVAGVWAVLMGLLPSAPWIAALPRFHWDEPLPYVAMAVASIAGFAFTFGVFWFFWQRRPYFAAGWMAGGFAVVVGVLYGWVLPQSSYLQPSSRVAEILRKHDGLAGRAKVGEVVTLLYNEPDDTYGYSEPTLPYYQGGTLRELTKSRYLDVVPEDQWPRLMVVSDEIWNSFVSDQTKQKIEVLGTVHAYLYASGNRVGDVMVIRAKRPVAVHDRP